MTTPTQQPALYCESSGRDWKGYEQMKTVMWIEIFGTQEGVGYNFPQGAYDFAEVVMAYQCDIILNKEEK